MKTPVSYQVFLFSAAAPLLIFGDFNNQVAFPKLHFQSSLPASDWVRLELGHHLKRLYFQSWGSVGLLLVYLKTFCIFQHSLHLAKANYIVRLGAYPHSS